VPLVAPVIRWPNGEVSESPSYTSDMIVREDSDIHCFEDLKGRVFAYNDDVSLSGYVCLKIWMYINYYEHDDDAARMPFFKTGLRSGGHSQSMLHILNKQADCAVIDRVTRTVLMRENPGKFDGLRVLEDVIIGTFPGQPVCVAKHVPPEQRANIQRAFLNITDERVLSPLQFLKYCPVDEHFYDDLEEWIRWSRCVRLY